MSKIRTRSSMYAPLWKRLKQNASVTLRIEEAHLKRVKKGIIKEKYNDASFHIEYEAKLCFKTLNAEQCKVDAPNINLEKNELLLVVTLKYSLSF